MASTSSSKPRTQAQTQAGGYVRPAKPSEHPAAIRVLTRAFAQDPAMNWYGCVTAREAVDDVDRPSAAARRTMRRLGWFQAALVKATLLVGGYVTVAVVPRVQGGEGHGQDEDEDKGTRKEAVDLEAGEEAEEVAGVALWLPPGKTMDVGPITVLRSGLLKVLWGWGVTGVKRVLFDFTPAVERTLEQGFKARGLDRRDSWHLLEMVVDPRFQGRGLSTMLVEEGFRRASPKPVHLEATKASTRDIYAHFGFEVDEEYQFGVGAVNMFGVKAKGEAATGYPEWVMTKWTT